MNNKIYVLSTGRCGTTLLSRAVSCAVNNNIIPHQYGNAASYYYKQQGVYAQLINTLGNIVHAGILPKKLLKIILNIDPKNGLPYSSGDNMLAIAISDYLYNYCHSDYYYIIHLVRNPKGVIRSFMNWKNRKLSGAIAHHFLPFWRSSPLADSDISLKSRIKMDKFEHFAWLWNYENYLFYKRFKEKNYLLIKFEDLIDKNKKYNKLKEVFRFVNIDNYDLSEVDKIFNKKVNKTSDKKFPHWKNWSNKQKDILDFYCRSLMDKFGYK